ncbi:hypothetical protein EYZ11_009936 [Aspergillus tanneri]|nr:hypothetical protein EYZ11_009936 [Aspergillus tanneri]
MPPPLGDVSDDESTGESIPFNNAAKEKGEGNNVKPEEDDEDDEDEEGVYTVEEIVGHDFAKDGSLLLQVKWKNYDDPEDQTMEPEANLLEGAEDIVKEYFRSIGGRPQKQGRKRKSLGAAKQTLEKAEPKKRRKSRADQDTEGAAKKEKEEADGVEWMPKSKNWENEVEHVDTIMREQGSLIAFLQWTNGKKSKVSIETCYEKCPKKMLKFYEQHL